MGGAAAAIAAMGASPARAEEQPSSVSEVVVTGAKSADVSAAGTKDDNSADRNFPVDLGHRSKPA